MDIPAAGAGNTFTEAAGVWTATASGTIPCEEGDYATRFYVVPASVAGTNDVVPGADYKPAFFIDVNTSVMETGDCELGIDLEVFLIEFIPDYDFNHGGAAIKGGDEAQDELPEVTHNGENAGSTRNIAKKTKEDGTDVDTAYPAKDPCFVLQLTPVAATACPCCLAPWGGPVVP